MRVVMAVLGRLVWHALDWRRVRGLIRSRGVRAEMAETVRELSAALRCPQIQRPLLEARKAGKVEGEVNGRRWVTRPPSLPDAPRYPKVDTHLWGAWPLLVTINGATGCVIELISGMTLRVTHGMIRWVRGGAPAPARREVDNMASGNATRPRFNGREYQLSEPTPAERNYPHTDRYQWQEFACLAVELGGHNDITIIDPYSGRRFWYGQAFLCDRHAEALAGVAPGAESMAVYHDQRGCTDCNSTSFITALRRALDALEATGGFPEDARDESAQPVTPPQAG